MLATASLQTAEASAEAGQLDVQEIASRQVHVMKMS
jgi:hypothetical protein